MLFNIISLLLFFSYFAEVILTSDDEKNSFAFDLKKRLEQFKRSNKNEKANEMEEIENKVESQIEEAIGLIKNLTNNEIQKERHQNFNEFGSSYSFDSDNLPTKDHRASSNTFHIPNCGIRIGTSAEHKAKSRTSNRNNKMFNELEQQAAGIKQTLSAQKTATNEQPQNTLSNTRKKLLELRARMDKVGIKPMHKANSGEERKQSLTISPTKSPKGIVVDKRKIQRDKILNKWRWLMGSVVLSMQELYFNAEKSQKYKPIERQLLSETLTNLKLAKHEASKDSAQILVLLSNAKKFFDQYQTHRKKLQQAQKIGYEHLSEDDDLYQSDLGSENEQENSDNHQSSIENSGDEEANLENMSEVDAEMDRTDSVSDKTEQHYGYHYVDHDASTEHSDYDGDFCGHGNEMNSNDSGQSIDESSYHGTSITMTDYEKLSDSDQTDYYDGLKTDEQYHSEIFDQESPKQKSVLGKAYSSDGELTSARKTDLNTENLKNKHRTVNKSKDDQKVIAKSEREIETDDEKSEYETETTNGEESDETK